MPSLAQNQQIIPDNSTDVREDIKKDIKKEPGFCEIVKCNRKKQPLCFSGTMRWNLQPQNMVVDKFMRFYFIMTRWYLQELRYHVFEQWLLNNGKRQIFFGHKNVRQINVSLSLEIAIRAHRYFLWHLPDSCHIERQLFLKICFIGGKKREADVLQSKTLQPAF